MVEVPESDSLQPGDGPSGFFEYLASQRVFRRLAGFEPATRHDVIPTRGADDQHVVAVDQYRPRRRHVGEGRLLFGKVVRQVEPVRGPHDGLRGQGGQWGEELRQAVIHRVRRRQ